MHPLTLLMLYGHADIVLMAIKDNEAHLMTEALICIYTLTRDVTRSYRVLIVISWD